MKPASKRPVTIEDLLHLKRAERPRSDFWSQFDRELRAKQLSALLAKRPWWQRVPSPWPFFVRHRILLGASAVLAVTFVSVQSVRVSPPVNEEIVDAGAQQAPFSAVAEIAVENRALVVGAGEAAGAAAPVLFAVDTTPTPAAARVEQPFSPAASSVPTVAGEAAVSLTQRFPTGLVATAAPEMPAARKLGAGFENRAPSARPPVEPLHQITPPSESRRARLLTAMVSMASHGNSSGASERVASRIDEDRLYDQVSRFAAKGDRLNVKF